MNGELRSSVTRLAINVLRIMSVVALLRAIKYNPLATPLFRHTIYALTILPEAKQVVHKVKTIDVILSHSGNTFTSWKYYEAAEMLGIKHNTAKSCLHRSINSGKIEKDDSSPYYKVRAR